MKTTYKIGLKNSYKYLQKKMWEINSQTNELNKQNLKLKGKMTAQRMMSDNNKSKTTYIKKLE